MIAPISTYFSAFSSGDLEPFWSHFVLLSVSITAGFAVGMGILLESPKNSAAVHRIATWLVLGGIAVESLCTVLLFVFDEGISSSQKSKIILLETQIRGREISREQTILIMSELKGHGIPTFTVVSVSSDIEAGRFAVSIWSLLRTATGKEQKIRFLEKEPDNSGLWLPLTMACGDSTPESDLVIKALWTSGVVDRYFPVRSPIPGKETEIVLTAPYFCPPNSVFVGPRIAAQEIWQK